MHKRPDQAHRFFLSVEAGLGVIPSLLVPRPRFQTTSIFFIVTSPMISRRGAYRGLNVPGVRALGTIAASFSFSLFRTLAFSIGPRSGAGGKEESNGAAIFK